VLELVGVDHGPDRLNDAVGDVEGQDVDHEVFGVVGHQARLAVDPGRLAAGAQVLGPARDAEHEAGHPLGPEERLSCRPGLAAAVPDHDHVGGEQVEQAGQVAARGRGEEPARHLLALRPRGVEAGSFAAGPALGDVLPGPGEDLAAVRLGLAGDLRDLGVFVAEHLMEQEHRAFGRGQAFQQDEEGHRQGICHLRALGRVRFGARDERFGQPGADVRLAPYPRRAQVADGQPGGDRGQVRLGRGEDDAVAERAGEPQERLLDDVLGVADAAGHPVGDREHQRPEILIGPFLRRRHHELPPSPTPGSRPASSGSRAPSQAPAWPSRWRRPGSGSSARPPSHRPAGAPARPGRASAA